MFAWSELPAELVIDAQYPADINPPKSAATNTIFFVRRMPLSNRSALPGSEARDDRNRIRLPMEEWRQLRSSCGIPLSTATRSNAEVKTAAPVEQIRSGDAGDARSSL